MARDIERIPNDDEDEIQVITLEFEDDTTLDCGIVAIFTIEDQDYVAVAEVDENNAFLDEMEIMLYRYYEELEGKDTFTIENIEDDEEMELVVEVFEKIMNDEIEEDEDEDEDDLLPPDEEDDDDALVQDILNRIIRDKKY